MSSSHSGAEVDLLSSFVVLPPVHSEDHTPFPAEPNVVNHFGDDLYRGVLENYGGEATLTHSQTIGSTPLSSSPHDEVKKISEMRATYLKKGCQLRSPARDTSVSVLATLTDIELDILKQEHVYTLNDLVNFPLKKLQYSLCKGQIFNLDALVLRTQVLLETSDL